MLVSQTCTVMLKPEEDSPFRSNKARLWQVSSCQTNISMEPMLRLHMLFGVCNPEFVENTDNWARINYFGV
jgi:hypothetical protein